jgi:hypothetical protein
MLLGVLVGAAQEQGNGPLVSMAVDAAGARPAIRVTNNHSVAMAAFVVTVNLASGDGSEARIVYDMYTNSGLDYPVASGRSVQRGLPYIGNKLDSGNKLAAHSTATLRAALFVDGQSWGEPQWVDTLLLSRRTVLDQLTSMRGLLQQSMAIQRAPKDTLLILEQRRLLQAERHRGLPLEQRVQERRIAEIMRRNLSGSMRVAGKIPDHPAALRELDEFAAGWIRELEKSKPALPPLDSLQVKLDRESQRAASSALSMRSSLHKPQFRLAALQSTQCMPTDVSTVITGPDSCGNTNFDLKGEWQGTVYDDGLGASGGVCTGGYDDCNANFVPVGAEEATENLVLIMPSNPDTIEFSFLLDSWFPVSPGCACTDPNPNGHTQVNIDHQFLAAEFLIFSPGCMNF